MYQQFPSQTEHFAILKSKYQATNYTESSPSSLLYLILRKVDLEIKITDIELNWLKEHQLLATLKIILWEQLREEEPIKLQYEFSQLNAKYQVNLLNSQLDSPLYPILWKLESENQLAEEEIVCLRNFKSFKTVAIAEEMGRFATLKSKYKATQHQDPSPDSPLYQILKLIDTSERLSDIDVNWLNKHQLFEPLKVFQQQEAVREGEFAQLKDKYKAAHPDTSVSSPLYPILQNLESDKLLTDSEIEWLKQHQLSETIEIVQELEQKREFAALKVKYKATQDEDSFPSSHLYKLLKRIELGNPPYEQDINYLKKRELTETIAIANEKYASDLKLKIESGNELSESEIDWLKNNGRENIIIFAQQQHFAALKVKYRILDPRNGLPLEPFYTIMQKLEREERLDPIMIVQLIEEELLSRHGKIAKAHYRLEALFNEQEFKRTGNKWNLPNASSHWRKADEPQRALQVTNNLDFGTIKENKLKSALLTTRGGTFRDIDKLEKAEDCARKAIEYQSSSHHPYTLMGAICYERHQYSDGDYWFNEAIKRGAEPEDIDDEIKRVVKNTNNDDKRQEVVEYLLKKDPVRYAWAKSYLK
ncbi:MULTISPECIES: hypothetical protein [Cyanophyceae]|uniref:hypothetical protein n=1 Tax=Cyanophyceae TaxID=3028117 RepID=UPI00168A3D99|nr:hypothetical protein [Trichocoleus sp. FACHB-40]MBD2005032.1 hypothetical protein [Trichocoleus sp. FACHB-40]